MTSINKPVLFDLSFPKPTYSPHLSTQISGTSITDADFWTQMGLGFGKTFVESTASSLIKRFAVNEIAVLARGFQAAAPILRAASTEEALAVAGVGGLPATIGLLAIGAGSFYLINHFIEGGSWANVSMTDFAFTMGMMAFNEAGMKAFPSLARSLAPRILLSFGINTAWESVEGVARTGLSGDTNWDHLKTAALHPLTLEASVQRAVFTVGFEAAHPVSAKIEASAGKYLNHIDMARGAKSALVAGQRWAQVNPARAAIGFSATAAAILMPEHAGYVLSAASVILPLEILTPTSPFQHIGGSPGTKVTPQCLTVVGEGPILEINETLMSRVFISRLVPTVGVCPLVGLAHELPVIFDEMPISEPHKQELRAGFRTVSEIPTGEIPLLDEVRDFMRASPEPIVMIFWNVTNERLPLGSYLSQHANVVEWCGSFSEISDAEIISQTRIPADQTRPYGLMRRAFAAITFYPIFTLRNIGTYYHEILHYRDTVLISDWIAANQRLVERGEAPDNLFAKYVRDVGGRLLLNPTFTTFFKETRAYHLTYDLLVRLGVEVNKAEQVSILKTYLDSEDVIGADFMGEFYGEHGITDAQSFDQIFPLTQLFYTQMQETIRRAA